MPYYVRILAVVVLLLGIIGVLIWRGPQQRDVSVLARSPEGQAVPAGAPLRITFSRAVDRLSLEQQFQLVPPATGSFAWDGNILTFRPDQPLQSNTTYTVTIRAGLRDSAGRANQQPITWSFRTRAPRLLILGSNPDESSTLWYADADGRNAAPVYTAPIGMLSMAAAPDGVNALVVVRRDQQRSALVLVNLNTGEEREVVDAPDVTVDMPAWSPRGDLLMYEWRTIVGGVLGQPRVWLAQPDGTSLGPIIGGEIVSSAPVWSPDGRRIAFSDGISRTLGIYDFGDAPQLFPDSTGERASWSPDSRQLAYTAADLMQQPPRPTIRLATLSDGRSTPLVTTPGATSPAWSPDGRRIAYTLRDAARPTATLWQIGSDGSNPEPLTRTGDYRDTQPSWSPDARLLAFLRTDAVSGASTAHVLDTATPAAPPQPLLPDVQAVQVEWVP